MAWFRLEGRGAFHHKVVAAGDEAYGAWVRAGQWSCDQLTDGLVPIAVALQINRKSKVWAKLCEVKLLHKVDGGYQIHDFLDWNPSSETERERREVMREKRRDAGRIGGKKSGEVRRANAEIANDSAEKSPEARSKNEAKCFNDCFTFASDLLEAKPKQNEAPNPNPNPNPSSSSSTTNAHVREGNSAQDATTLAQDASGGTDTLPPTQKRQDGAVESKQPPSSSTGRAPVVWVSPDEQTAGDKLLTALLGAGRGDAPHGPLAQTAEVRVVRELLTFTNAAGNMGRLRVDDVIAAIEHVAEKERARLLSSVEAPKNAGELVTWLRSTVKGWRRDGQTPAKPRGGHSSGRALQPITPVEFERERAAQQEKYERMTQEERIAYGKTIPDIDW